MCPSSFPRCRSFLWSSLNRLFHFTFAPLFPTTLSPVAFSSRTCAAARAYELDLPNPLVYDPYSRILAGPVALRRLRSSRLHPRIAIRTRYFDNAVNTYLTPDMQLVILAAGMDTRAYRLPVITVSTAIFEVDVPEVFDLKERLIASINQKPHCRGRLRRIRADLSLTDWPEKLQSAGFSPELPTFWLVEGLLYYLLSSQVNALVDTISRLSPPRSVLIFSAVTALKETTVGLPRYFQSAIPDPVAFVANYGFRHEKTTPYGSAEANYGRIPVQQLAISDYKGTIFSIALKE